MAKSKSKGEMFSVPTDAITIENMGDAIAALEQMEEINAQIEVAQKRTVELKKNVTQWAVDKRVDVVQLDGHYYRQINRTSRGWDADILKGITLGIKIKGKSLWNLISKRVPDPEKIDRAVKNGWVTEKKISRAYVEKPQAPFLQKFTGDAVDA